MLNDALRYAELGYPIFPCAGRQAAGMRGCKEATTDEEQISAWWQANPDANIGLATAGLIVVDVDGKHNPWLANSPDRAMELAAAPMALTPSGGRHYLFRAGRAMLSQHGRQDCA